MGQWDEFKIAAWKRYIKQEEENISKWENRKIHLEHEIKSIDHLVIQAKDIKGKFESELAEQEQLKTK